MKYMEHISRQSRYALWCISSLNEHSYISDYNLIQNVSKQIDGCVRFNIAASNIILTKQDIV